MKLYWSSRSPFVRKAMIAAHEKNLISRIEIVPVTVSLSAPPIMWVLADNPLGKIPTLILDDGTALFDSRVICEYFDGIGEGPRLIPLDPADRIECHRWAALGDGFCEVLLFWRTEMGRKQLRNEAISRNFDIKARASLAQLETEVPRLADVPFSLGHIAIACALGQLDFRYAGSGWRTAHPQLAAWVTEINNRPSLVATAIRDDGAATSGNDAAMPLQFAASA